MTIGKLIKSWTIKNDVVTGIRLHKLLSPVCYNSLHKREEVKTQCIANDSQ